jgi:RHS repeat-associated protein
LNRKLQIANNGNPKLWRSGLFGAYRYGFQNQEHDNELWSGAVSYKYRVEDPRLGRFFSVDPLAAKYPHNSVYAFSENRVVDGVELEGLECYIVHGTVQSQLGVDFVTNGAINELQRITNNTKFNDEFRWSAPYPPIQTSDTRGTAALKLYNHIIQERENLLASNSISPDEPISIVGYSHGGNVAIQAALLFALEGKKVNIITISTPAYDLIPFNNENPEGNKGILNHIHIVHENDNVGIIGAGLDGHKYEYLGDENYVISEEEIPLSGGIESHTELPQHEKFDDFLKKIPSLNENENKN